MKLNKKEVGMVRSLAFYKNVLDQTSPKQIELAYSLIPEKKHELARQYHAYLTNNEGKKVYVVDFKASGSGHMTFHGCTAEEAKAEALHKLQNGAFGNYEKLEDITILKVRPETIFHNQFVDFLNWKQGEAQIA